MTTREQHGFLVHVVSILLDPRRTPVSPGLEVDSIGMEVAKLAHVLDACPPEVRDAFTRFPARVLVLQQSRDCRNDILVSLGSNRRTQLGSCEHLRATAVPLGWLDRRRLEAWPPHRVDLPAGRGAEGGLAPVLTPP